MQPSEWIHNRALELASSVNMQGRSKLSPTVFYGLATEDFRYWSKSGDCCVACHRLPCKCK